MRTARHFAFWLLLISQVACWGADDKPLPKLFQELVNKEGSDYLKARGTILAYGDDIRPFLKHTTETSPDWQRKVAAKILLGWLDNPEQYKELWAWQVSPSQWRNPFPFYYREAHAKFSQAGAGAIPLMLELIWKKQESQHGALPALLAELRVESALPILVRMKDGNPQALGQFGTLATPHILEVLPAAKERHRAWLVQSLGLTGGERAVAELRSRLNSDDDRSTRKNAALALGQLGQYQALRSSYSQTQNAETRLAILKALSQDKSDETRALLVHIATTAPRVKDGSPYNTERLRAVQALLENATEKDVAALCEFAPKEPHAYTKACFFIYLARPDSSLVRELFLNALQDPDLTVKTRAVEGLKHYPDDRVTDRVLELIQKTEESRLRRAGIFMLKDRNSPRVRAAAETWLTDQDPEIQRWAAEALKNNKPTSKPTALQGFSKTLCYDGKRLLGAQGGTAYLWDARTGKELQRFQGYTGYVNAVTFSPDGQHILTSGASQVGLFIKGEPVKLWNTVTGREIRRFQKQASDLASIFDLQFSPDGQRMLTAKQSSVNILQVWDAGTGALLFELPGFYQWIFGPPIAPYASFSSDGSRIVMVADSGYRIKIWDATNGKEICRVEKDDGFIGVVQFSPDGRKVLTTSSKGSVKTWDATIGQPLQSFVGHTQLVSQACFTPDGQKIVTASYDGSARLWDANTAKELRRFQHPGSGPIDQLLLSSDGKRLLTLWSLKDKFDTTVNQPTSLWDVESGRELLRLTNKLEVVAGFSPIDETFITAKGGKPAALYDSRTGQLIRKYEEPAR